MGEPPRLCGEDDGLSALQGHINLEEKTATFGLSSLANEGTHRALESSSGHKSEQGRAGELISQRLQQTASPESAKDDR